MSTVLIAEFDEADALLAAARESRTAGDRVLDAFSPFPIEGMAELLGATSTRLRLVMAIGGLGVAALMLGTEWYSAVIDYPINSGGRPLNSWPAFMLPPFAVGILAAAICGFIALHVGNRSAAAHPSAVRDRGFRTSEPDSASCSRSTPASDDATAERARPADAVRRRRHPRGAGMTRLRPHSWRWPCCSPAAT